MKLAVIVTSIFFLAQSADFFNLSSCPAYYIFTKERGCVKSCTHPEFKSCPDSFVDIWNPEFCALGWDGEWQSFTHACQACGDKNKKYSGVAYRKCE